jgi:hypothetical protein
VRNFNGIPDIGAYEAQTDLLDAAGPVINNCPTDITTCSPVTSFVPPFATDNCNVNSFIRSISETTTFSVTTHEITYVATDEVGNTDSCVFEIVQYPLPTADAGPDITITSGSSDTLGGSPTGMGGAAPYIYFWSPTVDLDSSTVANPIASPAVTTDFIVFVVDTNGCAGTDVVEVTVVATNAQNNSDKAETTNSMNVDKSGFDVSLFPNPTDGIVHVHSINMDGQKNMEGEFVKIEVMNLLGEKIYSEQQSVESSLHATLDLSGLAAGQYLMKIQSGETVIVKIFTSK